MSEFTMPEAFTAASEVKVGDWLCLTRRADAADDLWDEVLDVEALANDRVTVKTRVVGPSTYLSNDRVTIRRPQPDDDLITVLAYAVRQWWTNQESGAAAENGGSDQHPDADDWDLAVLAASIVREYFDVIPAVRVPNNGSDTGKDDLSDEGDSPPEHEGDSAA